MMKSRFIKIVTIIFVLFGIICLVVPVCLEYMRQRRVQIYIRQHLSARVKSDMRSIAFHTQWMVESIRRQPPEKLDAFVCWLDAMYFEQAESIAVSDIVSGGVYVREDKVLYDNWGHPLELIVESEHHYTFKSLGPNGQDDSGDGDDIVYTFNPLKFLHSTTPASR